MPVKTPPPPKSKKGDPPASDSTKGNLAKPEPTKHVALNFRVPAELKKDFKIASATHGITQSQLLAQAFQIWKAQHN